MMSNHIKNKSAGAIIPKLDLTKIKRDVDIEDKEEDEDEFDPDESVNVND
jgi:hypothetical protein